MSSTAATIAELAPPPAVEAEMLPRQHRFTVEEYHRLCEAGAFGDARTELIWGVIVYKMTKNDPHVISTDLTEDLLHRLVPPGFFVSMGNPITMIDLHSEPEPDAMVIRGAIRDYKGRRRTPADAALVVEVADSSLRSDRQVKGRLYATAGVPVYWIVNLVDNVLEVHTRPGRGDGGFKYGETRTYQPDEEVPLLLDGREVARLHVRDILP